MQKLKSFSSLLVCLIIAVAGNAQKKTSKKVKQVKAKTKTYVSGAKYAMPDTIPVSNATMIGNKQIEPDFIITPSGIAYKFIVKGNGTYIGKVDDKTSIHIRSYASDSMLFDSYKLNNNEPVPAVMRKPDFNGDVNELMLLMKEGDSLIAYVNQDSLFRNDMRPPFVKKCDPVFYQIKMISVQNKEEFEQRLATQNKLALEKETIEIEKYLVANKLTNALKTESGIQYVYIKKGDGTTPKALEKVSLNYTGKLLNGEVFDSNEDEKFKHKQPLQFKLGKGQVIKGWDEMVALMKKGDRLIAFIPSPLAYGSQGRPNIPGGSTLVFEMELLP
jgi:FKBP-type peptidyl-prolyl cis-trans isomerase FkpA